MDKHLVNIDDLVRQRLLGGEERERAGAWARMSELLEEEMPQVRPVAFMWRRMFGVVAVLVLIGGISLGGYELNAYKNLHHGNNDAAIIASNANATNSATNGTGIDQVNATPVSISSTADNNQAKNDEPKKAIASNVQPVRKGPHSSIHKSAGDKTESPVINNKDGDTKVVADNASSVNKPGGENVTAVPVAVKKTPEKTIKKTELTSTDNQAVADNKQVISKTNGEAKTNDNKELVATTTKSPQKENSLTGKPTKDVAPAKTDKAVAGLGNDKKSESHKTTATTAKPVGVSGLALGASIPTAPGADKKATAKESKSAPKGHVIGVPTGVVNATHSPKAPKGITNTASIIDAKNKKDAGADKTSTPGVAEKGSKDKGMNDISAINAKKGKKVIERMVVNLHTIRNSAPGERLQWRDTVSLETLTEEFDMVTPANIVSRKNAMKTGNEVASSGDPDADSSPFKPSSSFSTDSKENNFEKNTTGKKAIESLNAAFNDIKYKAGHAQFQTGITAGINGTFFGPNGFKGFQFGITGKLVFSDALSLMSELKYFNRINNNYSLHDDYYSYTPVAGGYSRELVSNPYSISTLHSFEMPISLRYSQGNFNFFFGPNAVYTFAINTGDYPIVVPSTTPNIVSAPGNDNTPKVKSDDFNSRFGVGYLFGVSLQVSPKMVIDLRDVQTVWDNARTPGAKYISSQLYRSPSFQLSIGYRLGGNKERNK